jgi:hypothetical protein
MSRTATYEALAQDQLIAIKLGRRTLIDVEQGVAWLRSRPKAKFQAAAGFARGAVLGDEAARDE